MLNAAPFRRGGKLFIVLAVLVAFFSLCSCSLENMDDSSEDEEPIFGDSQDYNGGNSSSFRKSGSGKDNVSSSKPTQEVTPKSKADTEKSSGLGGGKNKASGEIETGGEQVAKGGPGSQSGPSSQSSGGQVEASKKVRKENRVRRKLPDYETVCSKCGEAINGKYYPLDDGRKLCVSCYDKSKPRCSVCGQEINGKYTILEDGRKFCASCYDKSKPKCAGCGQKINGKYYTIKDGRKFCVSCYEKIRPRCAGCGQNINGKYYTLDDGRKLCASCYEKSRPLCDSCGQKIGNKWSVFKDGLNCCKNCSTNKSLPHCTACNIPVAQGGLELSDGRRICPFHAGTGRENDSLFSFNLTKAVVNEEQLQAYYPVAKKLMLQYASPRLKLDGLDIQIYMVNGPEIRKVKDGDECGLACPRYDRDKNFRVKRRFDVYILEGQHPEDALDTICHELAHVWHHANTRASKYPKRRVEGFAEWVAYKVNQGLGRKEQIKGMLAKEDQNYSGGLKDYLKIESESGVAGVFDYALGNELPNSKCVKCHKHLRDGLAHDLENGTAECEDCYLASVPKCAKCHRLLLNVRYYDLPDGTRKCEGCYLNKTGDRQSGKKLAFWDWVGHYLDLGRG